MSPKISQAYLDELFSSPDFDKLVELSGYLYAAGGNRGDDPTYGLPRSLFVFVESLTWFSQAERSGVWTYYEATPNTRQDAMLRALECEAPDGFAAHYVLGMGTWRDQTKIDVVDVWLQEHEDDINRWLWRLINQHRNTFERLCAL
jgi:hypothetical protein